MPAKYIPKAELHMHIDGAIEASVAYDVVKREIPERLDELFRKNDAGEIEYNYDDFIGFLNCIDSVAPLTLVTPDDYEALTYGYLKNAAGEGMVYCEMIVCPGMWHTSDKYDFSDMMAAFTRGIDRAQADFGIESRCKATLERGDSQEAIDKNWWATKQIVENSDHPYLVGLDLANYEQLGDIPGHKVFFDYIEQNQKKPLHISMHAGENAGPDNIRDAMAHGARRGGHITCVMEDPQLLQEVVANKFHGEICLSSNAFSKAVPKLEDHRITEIYNAGVRISLNTDDPTFFFTTIGKEYEIAQDVFGFEDMQLLDITLMAIEDSFAEDALKQKCIANAYKMMADNYALSEAEAEKRRGSGNKADQPKLKAA